MRALQVIRKLPALIEFVAFYLCEVILSNLRVAYDVLTPQNLMRPAIISVSTEGLTDRQLLILMNTITMTPGTLSLDVDEKNHRLFIHAMYVDDVDSAGKELETNYLKRICYVF